MLAAEKLIAIARRSYLRRTMLAQSSYERESLIELVRSLDDAAFSAKVGPTSLEPPRSEASRKLIQLGAASALRPFLEIISDNPAREFSWRPSTPERRAWADDHLMLCGHFSYVQRLASLEHYGLAETKLIAENHLRIVVASDADEAAERQGALWLSDTARRQVAKRGAYLASMKKEIAAQLDQSLAVQDGWFIHYDSTAELRAYHREFAEISAIGTVEAEALPANASLGGRSFESWNSASSSAHGRILQHIAFATRLRARQPELDLRNLLTGFARREDIAAYWREQGEANGWVDRITTGLTLDAPAARTYETDHEVPVPYYIDFGKHFVLLPMFGGLLNPYSGLVGHLRREYRTDWDRAVDGREGAFRADMRMVLPSDRYLVPDRGYNLARSDGSRITDIDALVLDRVTGTLGLVQLKWPDVFGLSLAERNSRRLNLLKANDWVGKVLEWVGGRSAAELAAGFGIEGGNRKPPVLLVMARHTARFSGETGYSPLATWISWPHFVQAVGQARREGVLERVTRRVRPVSGNLKRGGGSVSHHQLPGLNVDINLPQTK